MQYVLNNSEVNFPSNADIDEAIARARVLRSHAMHDGLKAAGRFVKGLFLKIGSRSATKPVRTSGGVIAAL